MTKSRNNSPVVEISILNSTASAYSLNSPPIPTPKPFKSRKKIKKLTKTLKNHLKKTGRTTKEPPIKPFQSLSKEQIKLLESRNLFCDESFQKIDIDDVKVQDSDYYEENLLELIHLEAIYKPNLSLFFKKQSNIDELDRAYLIDWMFFFGAKHYFKRFTLYIAINYVDRYLAQAEYLNKSHLKILGCAALLTACKIEEVHSKTLHFYTIDGVLAEHIINFEMVLLKKLKYKLNPPTIIHWAEYYMWQWDYFMELNEAKNSVLLMNIQEFENKNGKFQKGKSKIYQECFEFLDCMVLDARSLNFDMKGLILGVMYFVLGKEYRRWELKEVGERIREKILEKDEFTIFFMDFVLKYIWDFNELIPFLEYITQFLDLKLCQKREHKLNTNITMDLSEMLREDLDRVQSYDSDWMRVAKRCIGV